MATDFKTMLALDAAAVFCNVREFAELVTYTPFQDEPRVRSAVIERMRVEPTDVGPSGSRFGRLVYRLTIPNNATTGIAEIVVGKDQVRIKVNQTDVEETTFVVSSIVDQDAGAWHLELTK